MVITTLGIRILVNILTKIRIPIGVITTLLTPLFSRYFRLYGPMQISSGGRLPRAHGRWYNENLFRLPCSTLTPSAADQGWYAICPRCRHGRGQSIGRTYDLEVFRCWCSIWRRQSRHYTRLKSKSINSSRFNEIYLIVTGPQLPGWCKWVILQSLNTNVGGLSKMRARYS